MPSLVRMSDLPIPLKAQIRHMRAKTTSNHHKATVGVRPYDTGRTTWLGHVTPTGQGSDSAATSTRARQNRRGCRPTCGRRRGELEPGPLGTCSLDVTRDTKDGLSMC